MISPELLRRYPYFADISEDSLRQVAMISEERSAPNGTVIFQEGDVAEGLFIIAEGEVDIQYTLGSGEPRTVDTVVAGEAQHVVGARRPLQVDGHRHGAQGHQDDRDPRRKTPRVVRTGSRPGAPPADQPHQTARLPLGSARVQLATID